MDAADKLISYLDLDKIDLSLYRSLYVGCVVLTKDNKILLQQRGQDWTRYPGYLCEFGGHIEVNETPDQALVRELREELGVTVNLANVIKIGAISELSSNHTELIYVYFWHDKQGLITGCYEGEPRYFANLDEVFKHPKMMDSVRWLLLECQRRGYMCRER